ncbi:VCBS repeat-containing protein [Mycolicibacterium fluoranthenivorans]|uniref:VCBS repeat-containing protein n=1 Tax=Mycolicibacterium fluoranthenivorans TaxID=258505 RepID=A0A7X5ZDC3_9MYCO|nr:hypothetical protein [Mycolicibacterium fluoranthenivorans]NIH95923.1 VCBS repeat-containing protein [Mycolicibacterium fluoranthenivorans]
MVAEVESGSGTSAAKTSLFSAAATPVSGAVAASSLADLVPAPPDIPAFRPFAAFIEQFAKAVDKFFPAYPDNPILAPSQVAAGYVVTLQTLLQATLFNGAPTPLTVPVYLFLAAAYTRYERLATNHLPGTPIISAGPLPGTYKLTSTDPDGDPLIYTVGVNQQPSEGLIVMGLDGTFTYVPSPSGLVNGADVTFKVTINDGLGALAHPIAPDGNDVEYEVSFHYDGSPILGNQAPVFDTAPSITNTNHTTGVLTGTFQAHDPDGDALSFTGLGVLGTVDVAETPDENGWYTFTYTPYLPHAAAGLNLTDLVTITAWDPGLLSASKTFTVNLANDVNQVPVASYENTGSSTVLGTVTGKINVDSDDDIVHSYSPIAITTSKGTVVVSALTGDYTYFASADARAAASVVGASDAAKTDSFTITVDDLHGGTTDVLVTVTIPTTNLAPVFDSTPTITNSNTDTGVLTGTFKAHDPNGDSLTFTGAGLLGSVHVDTTPAADGTYTFTYTPYTPRLSSGLTDLVTLTASDGNVLSFDTTTFQVHLATVVNHAPFGGVASNIIADSNGIVRGKITGVVDVDGDSFTYSITGATGADTSTSYTGAGGIAHVDSDGSYTYIPKLGGSLGYYDSFSVTVSDGHGGTTDVLVGLGAIIAPTPSLDNVNITKTNTTAGVTTGSVSLGSASNNALFTNYTASGADYGTVTFNGTSYTYTRTAVGHVGGTDDTFDVMGTAYGLQIKVGTVTVTPIISNAAPTAGTTTITSSSVTNVLGVYWQSSNGKVTPADADGDAVSVLGGVLGSQLIGTSNGGTVTFRDDGTFTYTIGKTYGYYHGASADGATGNALNDTFNVTVTDSFGAHSTLTISIPIEQLNSAPSASVPTKNNSTDALGVVRGTLNGSDDDDDSLTYTLVGATNGSVKGSNGGIITVSGSSYTYIPTAGKTTDTFQVLVADGHGGTSTATVSLSGLSTPSPVTLTNPSSGVQNVTLNVPGADASLLTFSVGSQGTKGTVVRNADGTYTYTRTAGLGHTVTPADSFTIVGTTADGKTVTIATVNVAPSIPNSAPTANGVTVSTSSLNTVDIGINRQQTTTGTINATDADGDAVTFAGGTYGTANGGSVTVSSDGTFTYTSPKKLKNTIFGGEDSYWHNAAVPGAPGDTFTIAASDQFGGSNTLSFSIPIEKLNSTPDSSVSVGGKNTDALGVVRGTISGSDDDSDSLTYSLVGATNGSVKGSNGGIVQINGSSFTYVPTAGKTTDTFQVLVDDGHGGTSTATVSLSGLSTPSPATVTNTSTGVTQVTLNVPANDSSLLTFTVGSQGAKGSVVKNADGTFTYTRTVTGHTQTPDDSFTITATDASGKSVTIATVSVAPTVSNANPAGSTTTITSTGLDDNRVLGLGTLKQTTTGTLTATDSDSDAVTYTSGSFSTTNGGTVVINSNGTFSYTIDKSYSYYHGAAKIGASGTAVADSFSATVNDAFGGSTTYSVSVSIYAVNSAPTMGGGVRWYGSNLLGTYTSWTSVSGSDDDGDSLTYVVTQPTNGTVSYNGSTITTNNTKNGQTFTITAYDGYYVVGANGAVTSTPSSSGPRTFTMDQRSV